MMKLCRFRHLAALRLMVLRMSSHLLKHFSTAIDLTVNDTVSESTHSQNRLQTTRLMFLLLKRMMFLKYLCSDTFVINVEAVAKANFGCLVIDMVKAE